MTTEGAPSSAAESEPCLFCGDAECEWIRAANEAGRIDWHPPTVLGTIRPDLAAGLGQMQILRDGLGRLRVQLIPDAIENGVLLKSRLQVRRSAVRAMEERALYGDGTPTPNPTALPDGLLPRRSYIGSGSTPMDEAARAAWRSAGCSPPPTPDAERQ